MWYFVKFMLKIRTCFAFKILRHCDKPTAYSYLVVDGVVVVWVRPDHQHHVAFVRCAHTHLQNYNIWKSRQCAISPKIKLPQRSHVCFIQRTKNLQFQYGALRQVCPQVSYKTRWKVMIGTTRSPRSKRPQVFLYNSISSRMNRTITIHCFWESVK